MQYQKKAILLRSKENRQRLAILNLEQTENELLYGVSQWLDCMKECRIYLFFAESRWTALEGMAGKMQMSFAIQEIRAAAVIYDKGEFALRMSGEIDLDFKWDQAAMLIRARQMQTKPKEIEKPLQMQKEKERTEAGEKQPAPDTQGNIFPKEECTVLEKAAQKLEEDLPRTQKDWQKKEIGQREKNAEDSMLVFENGPYKDSTTQGPAAEPRNIPALEKASEAAPESSAAPKEMPFVPPAVRAQTTCTERREAIQMMPFPDVFPESCWYKVDFPFMSGNWHYISGEIYKNGILAAYATGVPGEYSLAPPRWLTGFQTYLSAQAGAKGYWLMFEDAKGNLLTLPELTGRAEA